MPPRKRTVKHSTAHLTTPQARAKAAAKRNAQRQAAEQQRRIAQHVPIDTTQHASNSFVALKIQPEKFRSLSHLFTVGRASSLPRTEAEQVDVQEHKRSVDSTADSGVDIRTPISSKESGATGLDSDVSVSEKSQGVVVCVEPTPDAGQTACADQRPIAQESPANGDPTIQSLINASSNHTHTDSPPTGSFLSHDAHLVVARGLDPYINLHSPASASPRKDQNPDQHDPADTQHSGSNIVQQDQSLSFCQSTYSKNNFQLSGLTNKAVVTPNKEPKLGEHCAETRSNSPTSHRLTTRIFAEEDLSRETDTSAACEAQYLNPKICPQQSCKSPSSSSRTNSLIVGLKIPSGYCLDANMAPVKDPNSVHTSIKDVVQNLFEVQTQVHGFVPETQPLLIDKMTDLARSLAHLQTLTSPIESPNNPIHRTRIAPEIIDYVDDGRNPDIFTRDFVELVVRGNAVINGKQKAFRDFSEIFADVLKDKIEGVGEEVDKVMQNSAAGERDAGERLPRENGATRS